MSTPLGEFLKRKREEFGWNQAELARQAGLPSTTVNRAETGTTKLPEADARRKLARALGVTHEALLIAAGELLPEEASRATAPRPITPDSGHDAVLQVIDQMTDEEARFLAGVGDSLLRWRRAQTVAYRDERVPALRS